MTSIECSASIDDQGHLHLDRPLSIGKRDNVRVIVLLSDEDLPDDLPEDESDESILAGLQRSLQELSDGKGIPLANLWDGIDAE
jgi:hypothetical protein